MSWWFRLYGRRRKGLFCQERYRRPDGFYPRFTDTHRLAQYRRRSLWLHRRHGDLGRRGGGLDVRCSRPSPITCRVIWWLGRTSGHAADLKGKRVGVTSIGGTGWMSALLIMEQIGISVERDKICSPPSAISGLSVNALETGTIQGAALAGVFSQGLASAWATGFPRRRGQDCRSWARRLSSRRIILPAISAMRGASCGQLSRGPRLCAPSGQ